MPVHTVALAWSDACLEHAHTVVLKADFKFVRIESNRVQLRVFLHPGLLRIMTSETWSSCQV